MKKPSIAPAQPNMMLPPATTATTAITTAAMAQSIRKFPARISTLPWARTFCSSETRSERRKKVSKAGIRLSTSSRRKAASGVVCSTGLSAEARRSRRMRACAFLSSNNEIAAKTATVTTAKTRTATRNCICLDLHPRFEDGGTEAAPGGSQAFSEMGRLPGGMENAAHFSAFVDAAALENENVLERDHVAFHADNLGDGEDLAGTVGKTGDLHNRVDGVRNLVADGALRNIQIRHRDHVLDAGQGISRGVRVHGGQRTFVARVHGLQHVEGFFATHLADHDAVGAHTQTVDYELAHLHGAFAFNVGRAGFETHDVFLLELQLGGVFDGYDAFGVRNIAGQNVEDCRFAGAGSSRDKEVQTALDHGREQFEHRFSQSLVVEHVARREGVAAETADGEAGSVEC